jgi:hypothetical protein
LNTLPATLSEARDENKKEAVVNSDEAHEDEEVVVADVARIEARANALIGIRETVQRNLLQQADRMTRRSRKFLPEVKIGDFVTLPCLDVDRGHTDPPNIICRVVDIDYEHSLFELACEAGVLSILYARNAFDIVYGDIDVKIRLDVKVGVREAIKKISIGGGQGMLKSNCTATCMTNRCSCKKNNLLCNSHCHGGNSSCKNK